MMTFIDTSKQNHSLKLQTRTRATVIEWIDKRLLIDRIDKINLSRIELNYSTDLPRNFETDEIKRKMCYQ